MIDTFIQSKFVHFESPWFFLLFPLLIVALIIATVRKRPTLTVSSIKPYLAAIKGKRRVLSPVHLPLVFEGLGVGCLIVALVRPQHGIEETIRRTEGIDIMLALDLSGSMEAFDVPKDVSSREAVVQLLKSGKLKPRIAVAKEEVERFIDRRLNDRIGMVAFAANTYTVCPPTLDHNFLKTHLNRLEAGMLPDGTGIAAPIGIAANRLKDSKAKRRVLVLFTDGDNNVDANITPLQAAKIADSFDISIHTVGIGSSRAFVIRPGMFGRKQLVNVQAGFNRQLLVDIADVSKGRYFAAEDADGLKAVMKSIDALEKTNLEQPTFIDYKELYKGWVACGLGLLCLGFIVENTLSLKVP